MTDDKARSDAGVSSAARRTGRAKPKAWYASAARNINTQLSINPVTFRDWADGLLAEEDVPVVKARIDAWLDSLKIGRLIDAEVFFRDWALIPDRRRPKAPSPMMNSAALPW